VVVREDARELLRDPAQLEDGDVGHLRAILGRKEEGGLVEPALESVQLNR
jgi:hypothetical protein